TLAAISPDWTAEELLAFQGTIAERDRIRHFRASLQEAEREAALAQEALRTASAQEREAGLAAAALGTESGPAMAAQAHGGIARDDVDGYAFVPETKDALQAAWAAFDEACRAWELEALRAMREAAHGISGRGAAAAAGAGTPALLVLAALAAGALAAAG